MTRFNNDRGTALLEVAMTLPVVLLVSVGIFEFGRAYQTQQILTNAAREGARVAVLPNQPPGAVQSRVAAYLQAGQISNPSSATVNVTATVLSLGTGTTTGSKVTVTYPYTFMVLQPVARLVVRNTRVGAPITLSASSEMRDEQ